MFMVEAWRYVFQFLIVSIWSPFLSADQDILFFSGNLESCPEFVDILYIYKEINETIRIHGCMSFIHSNFSFSFLWLIICFRISFEREVTYKLSQMDAKMGKMNM